MRIIINAFSQFYRLRLCRLTCRRFLKPRIVITDVYIDRNFHTTSKMASRKTPTVPENVFKGKTDRFEGVTVHSDQEYCDANEFPGKLKDSLEYWQEHGNRAIWFRVALEHSEWVPVLAKNDFKYHHAKDDFVMMYRWLPKSENCNIPHYAHTMVGVGAVVVNDKNQVLVVTEKYKIFNRTFWKLPGGYVEPGENLVDAAVREVKEETGVSTEFDSVLTFRHIHGTMFDCSDIYVVISLKPLTEDISKCQREIDECKWMDIEEYLSHPHVHELNRFFVEKQREYTKHNIKLNCSHGIHQVVNKAYTIYSVTRNDLDALVGERDAVAKLSDDP